MSRGRRMTVGAATLLALLGTIGIVAPGAARAATPVQSVAIGPLTANNGWTVTLSAVCGGSSPTEFEVLFQKGDDANSAEHEFTTDVPATCTFSPALDSGHLTVRWGSVLNVDVDFVNPGAPQLGAAVPAGCTGTQSVTRSLTASGTIAVNIHPSGWGHLSYASAAASVSDSGFTCPQAGASARRGAARATGYQADVSFSGTPVGIGASENANGTDSSVYIGGMLDDKSFRGMRDDFSISESGRSSASIGQKHATISGVAGLASGHVRLVALPACLKTPHSYNATVSGRLTFTDPALGHVVLDGSKATDARLQDSETEPGDCNGTYYLAPEVRLLGDCDVDNLCAIDGHKGYSADFSAESDTREGMGRFTTARITFGDGTSASITPNGSVKHTYRKAGTYVATLTVTYLRDEVGAKPETIRRTAKLHIDPDPLA